jgi:hypothetical protein
MAPRFWDVLSLDEIAERAEALPALGPHARAAGLADQWLLACIHRVAHHAESPHLLWIWDIHLLVHALGEQGLARALAMAENRRVLSLCLRALGYAHECFGTPLAADVRVLCAQEADFARREGLTAYLTGERRLIQRAWRDLRALPGWRDRAILLGEHLFPPAAYVRGRYQAGKRVWLPLLYAHRLGAGVSRWTRTR